MLRTCHIAPPGACEICARLPPLEDAAIQTIPLVRTSSVRPVIDYLDRAAIRPARSLERARALLRDPRLLIPVAYAGFLFAEAQRCAAADDFALRVGEATRLVELGEWGALLRESVTVAGTLRACMTTATRFNSGQRFRAVQIGNEVWFTVRITPRVTQGRAMVSQFNLMMMLEGIRLAAGPEWRPTEIHLEGPPPPHAEELAAHAAKQIFFDRPYTTIVFPADVLAKRYPSIAPPAPAAPEPVPAAEFELACRQIVEALLKLGTTELPAAAEMAQMSERSLQRGLAGRGYTFKRLVESVRFESAVRMLEDPSTKIVEIAADLGYTDSANFTRAFRRWSGLAPRAFRRNGETSAGAGSPSL
jgi:AraC-like DNA-binding protein